MPEVRLEWEALKIRENGLTETMQSNKPRDFNFPPNIEIHEFRMSIFGH